MFGFSGLRPLEKKVLGFNVAYLAAFLVLALRGGNHEFIIYAGVVLLVMVWILSQQSKVQFGPLILWGLTLWGFVHLAGGTIRVRNEVLYGLQLIPVVLRYDQLVHAFGFGVATLVCDHLLARHLSAGQPRTFGLCLLIILMGLGAGGVNEIVEFTLTKLLPETNVGGYDNTMWDMVFNLLGACLAMIYLKLKPPAPKPVT